MLQCCTQYNPPAQCFPVQTAFPPLSGNTEYTRAMQQQIAGNRDQKNSKTLHSGHTEKFTQGTVEKKRRTRVGTEPVCSQHSASQDTLRDCTKCRGIQACARFKDSLTQSLMRLLVAVAVRNLRSSAPFPSTRWSTVQGYFY